MVCKYREWFRHKHYAAASFQMVTTGTDNANEMQVKWQGKIKEFKSFICDFK